jgi:hypothetical protein
MQNFNIKFFVLGGTQKYQNLIKYLDLKTYSYLHVCHFYVAHNTNDLN